MPPPTAVVFKLKSVRFGSEILDIVSLKAECFEWLKEELSFMFWDVDSMIPVGTSSLLISFR